MSLLAELNTALNNLLIPVETGVFSGIPPDEYVVLTPMTDDFSLFADNAPQLETQEVRLSLFSKSNYRKRAKEITTALLAAEITITGREFVGFETDTSYFNYCINTAKYFIWEE